MMTARTTAILLCVSAIAMLASWLSIPPLMWDHLTDQDFSALVQHPMWIPVNVTLLIATVLLLPGMAGLFANLSKGGIRRHGVALIVTQFGVAWYACIQFYETFLWPLIARHSPELFDAVGFSASDPLVFGQLIASGLVWSLGFGLSPGNIYFEDGVWGRTEASNPDFFKKQVAANPMGRMGKPEEVASAAVYLASPASSFVSGTNLVVDGALTLGVQY